MRNINQIDNLFAQPGSRHFLKFQRVSYRRHVGYQLHCRFDMKLLFCRARSCSARQPCQLFSSQISPSGFPYCRLPVSLDSLKHIRAVSAFERVDDSIMHFPHAFAYVIQKPPVVRYGQQRSLRGIPAFFQMFGQPVDCEHIQMIRRLVEQKNIPVA